MINYGESMGLLRRRGHSLGDIIDMTEESAVLASYYRNNVLHLMLMPSLLACAFLNNASVPRADLQRLAWRVFPYVSDEYFLRWSEAELPGVVDELLEDLLNHGLLTASEDRSTWQRPATETIESVQLSVLARATVPILERFYLAISLLLKAGSGRLTQDALEHQCQLMAQRMSMLYELNAPEFFDKALFSNFIDLLRARDVLRLAADGKLAYEARRSRRSPPTRRWCCRNRSATASCRSCTAEVVGAHLRDAAQLLQFRVAGLACEPALLRCARRPRRPADLRFDQRLADHRHQPVERVRAVLLLRAQALRVDDDHPLRRSSAGPRCASGGRARLATAHPTPRCRSAAPPRSTPC